YVRGMNLEHLIRERGPLPVMVACDYIRQAALGLQHASEAGLVHRDIKPSNLLVILPQSPAATGYGLVKILDLGLALIEEESTGDVVMSRAQLTRQRSILGTPDFMSPEQALDSHKADIRSDLYSLGCTFYFLLSGQVPFPQGNPLE